MLYVRETKSPIREVMKRLEKAVAANKFGILGIYDLREKMAAKGVQFNQECHIVEICNPNQAKKVLEANMSISTALPCRISVYEESGKVKVATILPTAMLGLFEAADLQQVAQEVETTIKKIIDEAST